MLKTLFLLVAGALVLIALRIVAGVSVSAMARRRIGPVLCGIAGHRRDGTTVRRTREGYQARCRRCGARLSKPDRQSHWVRNDATRDGMGMQSESDGSGDAYSFGAREERSA